MLAGKFELERITVASDGTGKPKSVGDYKECPDAAQEQRCIIRCFLIPGNPTVIEPLFLRPVVLPLPF